MRSFLRSGFGCAILGIAGCAHVEPPSGGPEDKTPPAVAAVYPAPGALNVPRDARVVFQFTEWIDRNAVRGQVLISPPLPGRVRAEADGDRLVVQPPAGASLRAGVTYSVVAMGGLKDLRGNPLPRPFPLRFSTGPTLDSASVGGRVSALAGGRGSRVIALYRMGESASGRDAEALSPRDTAFRPGELPEPWRELPAYLAAADSAGEFLADAVAPGVYAMFAFEDVNGNLAFDVGLEPAAVGEARVALSAPGGRAPDQALRLAPLDTLPLRIAEAAFEALPASTDSAAGVVSGVVSVKFTRPPHPTRAAEATRYAVLPDSGAAVAVADAAWSPERAAWLLAVPPLKAGTRHRVVLRSRPDFAGRDGLHESDTSAAFTPEVPGEPAKNAEWKVAPLAAPGPSGLSRTGAPRPGAAQSFASSQPLSRARWEVLAARLEAFVGADTVTIPLRPRRAGVLSFAFDLPRALRAGERLELRLRAAPGATDGDSLPRTLYSGSVPDSASRGMLRVEIPADRRGWTFWATPAAGDGSEEIPLERSGDALKTLVPPGTWRVSGFLDRDRDGVRDPGALRPWIAQEPFAVIADTVKVTTGENLKDER